MAHSPRSSERARFSNPGACPCSTLYLIDVRQRITTEANATALNSAVYTRRRLDILLFPEPTISAITPAEGSADGGSTVTISGSGFDATSADAVRCGFGGTLQSIPPTSVTATQVVCLTTWGTEGVVGQPVSISLNYGRSFRTSTSVRFAFKGYNVSLEAAAPAFHGSPHIQSLLTCAGA